MHCVYISSNVSSSYEKMRAAHSLAVCMASKLYWHVIKQNSIQQTHGPPMPFSLAMHASVP